MNLLAPLLLFAAPVQVSTSEPLFAPATESLVIPAHTVGEEWSFFNLVEDYLRVTGQQFSYSEGTKAELEGARSKFLLACEVPPAAVQGVFETLLAEQHFAIVPDRSEHEVKTYTLLSLSLSEDMRFARRRFLPVTMESLGSFDEHPAVLIECLVPTGAIEARLLGNAVRAQWSDSSVNSVVPLIDANALLVRGRGPAVASQVRSWQRPAGLSLLPESGLRPEQLGLISVWPLPFIEKHTRPSLMDLLQAFVAETGVHFMVGPEARQRLASIHPEGGLPNSLAPDQVHRFIEELLCLHSATIDVLRVTEPRIFRLSHGFSSTARAFWLPNRIDPSTLEAWQAHPAIGIRTEFSTGKINARHLSNAFRGYITNANEESYVPMGGANWVAVSGFGPMLASRRAFVEQAAEYVVEDPEEQPEEEPEEAPSPRSDFNPLGDR